MNVCIEPEMCRYGVLYLQFKASIHTYRLFNRIEVLQSSTGEAIDIKGEWLRNQAVNHAEKVLMTKCFVLTQTNTCEPIL
jgi:hypothetical protein